MADQSNMHLFKDVYVQNEKTDPKEEKAVTVLEFIRHKRPSNLANEASGMQEFTIQRLAQDKSRPWSKEKSAQA